MEHAFYKNILLEKIIKQPSALIIFYKMFIIHLLYVLFTYKWTYTLLKYLINFLQCVLRNPIIDDDKHNRLITLTMVELDII